MPVAPSLRLVFLASLTSAAAAWGVSACSDETTVSPSGDDAGDGGGTSKKKKDGSVDEPDEEVDGGSSTKDAGKDADAKAADDANGPGEAGTVCSFNRECQAALRCECDEDTGCSCRPGPRGTGKNGVDPCDTGNDCASSVCVEGPTNGVFICSDECTSANDCTGDLPLCVPIAGFSEPICVRDPN